MKFFTPALAGLLLMTGAVSAEPATITFASPAPAPTPIHAAVMEVWARKVTEDSNGTLVVNFVPGATLGGHGQIIDRVKSGVIQIGWDIQGYYPGKFPKTDVVALPFGFQTAEAGTMALNRLLEDGVIADEYADVMVLTLFTFPNGRLMATRPIAKPEDMAGVKAAALNPARQAMISALGGTPVSLGIADWYQGLSRGVIDMALDSYSAVPPFRLAEVANHYTELDFGGNAAMMFMSREVFAALPPEAQKAIVDNSGPEFDRRMGMFWDQVAEAGLGMVQAAKGTVVTVAETDRPAWQAKLQPVIDSWVAATPDGASVLEAFRDAAAAGQ